MHEGEGRTLNCYGATTNLLEKGSGVNVYFVAAFNWDNRTNALGKSVYETFLKYQTGVHLGGGADSQSALKFEGANYKELARPDKPGCGFMTPTENTPSLRVITPFARG